MQGTRGHCLRRLPPASDRQWAVDPASISARGLGCLTAPGKAEVAGPHHPAFTALAACRTLLPGNLQSSHDQPLSAQEGPAPRSSALLRGALGFERTTLASPAVPRASPLLESPETRARIAGRVSSKTTHGHGHSELCRGGSVTRAGSGQHWLAAPGQEGPGHRWACPVHRQTWPCCPPCQQSAGKGIQNQSFPLRIHTCRSFKSRPHSRDSIFLTFLFIYLTEITS